MRALCIEQSAAAMARVKKTVKNDHGSFGISSFTARVYETLYGLNEVPVAEPGEIHDLLDDVLTRVLDGFEDRSKISIVVHVHTGPTVGLPGAPALQHALRRAGIHDALSFGVCCNRCVSFFNGLDIVGRFLQNDPEDARGLVISGEVACTNELRLVQNVAVVGDGVGAMLVNLEGPGDRLLSCSVRSEGRFARGVWLEGKLKGDYENTYQSMLDDVVRRALDEAEVRLEDVAWLLPHNTNASAWRFWAKSSGFPTDRLFLENISKTAHCFGTDLISNHAELRASNRRVDGERHLMAAAGLGGLFGAAVLECRDNHNPFSRGALADAG